MILSGLWWGCFQDFWDLWRFFMQVLKVLKDSDGILGGFLGSYEVSWGYWSFGAVLEGFFQDSWDLWRFFFMQLLGMFKDSDGILCGFLGSWEVSWGYWGPWGILSGFLTILKDSEGIGKTRWEIWTNQLTTINYKRRAVQMRFTLNSINQCHKTWTKLSAPNNISAMFWRKNINNKNLLFYEAIAICKPVQLSSINPWVVNSSLFIFIR